ncbi:NADH-ubiquinone oxidoreductase [Paramicrosporidium saccamoebae]|uniref:NADH-ubiquinone oxidoreductase n=1 Tax=Paramicrosporidium saccamoebae TaxID=1246581 RepID=A0A2H9TK89_9FUNG|nr:NADH-ubiquinone oxidoreductase [Paramicrosporidium saccamoebae]
MSTPNVIPSTSAPLLASSFILEQDCRGTNDAYILCRNANDDPAVCETLAHAVLECTRRSLDRVAASPCRTLFERFWRCLDVNNQDFIYCRPEEFSFEACTKLHLPISSNKSVKCPQPWMIWLWLGYCTAIFVRFTPQNLPRKHDYSTINTIFRIFDITLPNVDVVARLLSLSEYDFGPHYYCYAEPSERIDLLLPYGQDRRLHGNVFHIIKLLSNPSLAEALFVDYHGDIYPRGRRDAFFFPILYFRDIKLQRRLLELLLAKEICWLEWLRDLVRCLPESEVRWLFGRLREQMVPEIMVIFMTLPYGVELFDSYLAAASTDETDQLIADAIGMMSSLYNNSVPNRLLSGMTIPAMIDSMLRIAPTRHDCSFWGTLGSLLLCHPQNDQIAWYLKHLRNGHPFITRKLVGLYLRESHDDKECGVNVYDESGYYESGYDESTRDAHPTLYHDETIISHFSRINLPGWFGVWEERRITWLRESPLVPLITKTVIRESEAVKRILNWAEKDILPLNVSVKGAGGAVAPISDVMIEWMKQSMALLPVDLDELSATIMGLLTAWPYLLAERRKVDMSCLFKLRPSTSWEAFLCLDERLLTMAAKMGLSLYFTLSDLRLLTDSSCTVLSTHV